MLVYPPAPWGRQLTDWTKQTMLEIEKTLGRGFTSPEAAIAPLRAAKPSLRRLKGHVSLPEADLVYCDSQSGKRIELPVRVVVGSDRSGYWIVVEINRFPPAHLFLAMLVNASCALFLTFGYLDHRQSCAVTLIAMATMVLVSLGVIAAHNTWLAHEAIRDLEWFFPGGAAQEPAK